MDTSIVPVVSVEFEVFGKVQGIYFTKYCKEFAEQHDICGWVKNSKTGTIVGLVQGAKPSMDSMVNWISNIGSPGCHIERCELKNWQTLLYPEYPGFSIRF